MNTALNTKNYYGVFTLLKLTSGLVCYDDLANIGVCHRPHGKCGKLAAPPSSLDDGNECQYSIGNADDFTLISLMVGNDRLTKIMFKIKGFVL